MLCHLGEGERVPAATDVRQNVLFYDATCGVCCVSARFVAWARRDGVALDVAALGSAASRQFLTESERASAPDSVLVKTTDQRLLARSDALIFTLTQLGLPWSALSWVARLVPRNLRDRAYDAFAHRRQCITRSAPESAQRRPDGPAPPAQGQCPRSSKSGPRS